MVMMVVDLKIVKMMTKKDKDGDGDGGGGGSKGSEDDDDECSFFRDVQKQGLQDCLPDKWEIDIIKKLETGW
eukprot:3820303-Ditylum_brightwellii.AAC.1